ncbi:endonuclease MutS2 [Hippea alviniae]|uniref:endonuclease MutS2 n=1 Tax=Hippea alviniae TaxID=1279027 RepID=UPI0003B555F8|nr:Smr/MutS family protein [Hippea alviniae]
MRDTLSLLDYDKLKEIIKKQIQTEYGKKALDKLKPVFDFEKAKKEFKTLKAFLEHFNKWHTLTIDDIYISDIIEDSFVGMLDEKELKNIGDFISQLVRIKEEIESNEKEFYANFINFDIPYNLLDEITKAIDEHGLLKDSASAHLFEIRNEKKEVQQNITRVLKNIMHSRARDVLLDTAVFLKRSRYTILLKPNFKEYINGRIIDIGKSGGFFVEPDAVFNLNSRLEELEAKEEAERRRILFSITNLVRENVSRLKINERKIGFLDLNIAKYLYSKKLPECDIKFSNKPIIYAKKSKHPILTYIKEDTKPVDIDLKSNSKLIITGPNTGGKTVFLKTIGLIILSVYSAIPPSAEELTIGNFDNLFAVIGDQQDIFESLSGFSSKIATFKKAFEKATQNTLILLDEIGSGTSPDEGEAVAYAIIKETAKRCVVCASTHYKKLAYILQSEGFNTASFEFDSKTLKPTYRLTYGRIGKSYGIEIIKTLGLEKEIVETAKRFYKDSSSTFAKLESQLERNIEHYRKRKEELDRLKKIYSEIVQKEQKEKERFLEELKKTKEEKEKEFEKLIEELKNEIATLLKEKNISKTHKNLDRIKKQAEEVFKKEKTIQEKPDLQEGDSIEFNGIIGKLINIKNNKATVEIEGKMLIVDIHKLKKAKKEEKAQQVKINTSKTVKSLELNLIGKRSDEAKLELLKFIDSLAMDSIEKARIVHGHGSGILKSMVRETLKEMPVVKRFYPALPEEGGDGATIIELK